MSVVKDCPQCGEHNCVSDKTDLNYCMWCGYSFKSEREAKTVFIDSSTGQASLFDLDGYKSKQSWKG